MARNNMSGFQDPAFNPPNPLRASNCIDINVGGKIYTTTRKTIERYPDSKLAKMLIYKSIPTLQDNQGRYFIDRNGELFQYVLDYMRLEELNVPTDSPQCVMLGAEARFFELPGMAQECDQNKSFYYQRYPECSCGPSMPSCNKLSLWVKITRVQDLHHDGCHYADIPWELHLTGPLQTFYRLRWLDEYPVSHICTLSGHSFDSVSSLVSTGTYVFHPIFCKVSPWACEVLNHLSWQGFSLKGSHNGYLMYQAPEDIKY